jgi:hypothetical protein
LEKEGWPRHQVNGPVPLKGADGVVRSITNNNRLLEPTTPSAPAKEVSRHFINGRSHPSLTKEGTSPSPSSNPASVRSLTLRLFRPAHEATVQLRNQIPTWIAFHGVHGAVQTARGPWRTSGDWWRPNTWDREEWDVEVADMLYRIYYDVHLDRWYAQGVYD